MQIKLKFIGVFFIIFTLTGCATLGGGDRKIRINSVPAGAAVLANGVEIGVTPMSILQDEVFPPRWNKMAYQSSGVLSLAKPGCKTYTTQVNDALFAKNLDINLTCNTTGDRGDSDPVAKQSLPSNDKGVQPVSNPAQRGQKGVASTPLEQRFKRLDALHNKGIISDSEYNETRRRLLNEL